MLTNAGGRRGDLLILTKPIGTGLVSTAIKRRDADAARPRGDLHEMAEAAIDSMTRLHSTAAEVARRHGATAATDVTGYGLLGHLRELTRASRQAARLDAAAVPRLPGVEALVTAGEVPGGTQRNLADVRDDLEFPTGSVDDDTLLLLADAQTSGGLLTTVAPAAAEQALGELHATGHAAAIVGELVDGPTGRISIR